MIFHLRFQFVLVVLSLAALPVFGAIDQIPNNAAGSDDDDSMTLNNLIQ